MENTSRSKKQARKSTKWAVPSEGHAWTHWCFLFSETDPGDTQVVFIRVFTQHLGFRAQAGKNQ